MTLRRICGQFLLNSNNQSQCSVMNTLIQQHDILIYIYILTYILVSRALGGWACANFLFNNSPTFMTDIWLRWLWQTQMNIICIASVNLVLNAQIRNETCSKRITTPWRLRQTGNFTDQLVIVLHTWVQNTQCGPLTGQSFFSTVHPVKIHKSSATLQWRHNGLFTQPFIQAQIKENIKAPRQ